MKKIEITFLLIFPLIGFGQKIPEDLKVEFKTVFCECANLNTTEIFDEYAHKDCIIERINPSRVNYFKYFPKNPDLSESENLNYLSEKLINVFLEELVYECEPYYTKIEAGKEFIFNSFKKEFEGIDINIINQQIIETPDNFELYSIRGIIHFYNNNYLSASEDLNQSLKLNSQNVETLMLLGWINEKQGKLNEAIEFYQKQNNEFNLYELNSFLYLAKRKLNKSSKD